MWNEGVVAYFRTLLHHLPEGTEEDYSSYITIVGLMSENRTCYFPIVKEGGCSLDGNVWPADAELEIHWTKWKSVRIARLEVMDK
jgi:hypothetical protein